MNRPSPTRDEGRQIRGDAIALVVMCLMIGLGVGIWHFAGVAARVEPPPYRKLNHFVAENVMTLRVGYVRDEFGRKRDSNPYLFDFGLKDMLAPINCSEQLGTESRLYRQKQIALASVQIQIKADYDVPVGVIQNLVESCEAAGFSDFSLQIALNLVDGRPSRISKLGRSYKLVFVPGLDPHAMWCFALNIKIKASSEGNIAEIVDIGRHNLSGPDSVSILHQQVVDLFRQANGTIMVENLRDLADILIDADPHLSVAEFLRVVAACAHGPEIDGQPTAEYFRHIMLVDSSKFR